MKKHSRQNARCCYQNTFSAKKMQYLRFCQSGYCVAMMCATMREVL